MGEGRFGARRAAADDALHQRILGDLDIEQRDRRRLTRRARRWGHARAARVPSRVQSTEAVRRRIAGGDAEREGIILAAPKDSGRGQPPAGHSSAHSPTSGCASAAESEAECLAAG